jgi:hypothetical protein
MFVHNYVTSTTHKVFYFKKSEKLGIYWFEGLFNCRKKNNWTISKPFNNFFWAKTDIEREKILESKQEFITKIAILVEK